MFLQRSLRRLIVAAYILAASAPAAAQQKLLTIDDLYDPVRHVDFGETGIARNTRWLNDAELLRTRKEGAEQFTTVVVNAVDGAERPLIDSEALRAALRSAGLADDHAGRLSGQRSYTLSPDGTAVVLSVDDDLYYWRLGSPAITRITTAAGAEQEAAFSPDGRHIAYVRKSNLYVADLEGHERALTHDGGARIFNGRLDWVYQEEIYGRGKYRAFWWSPDSSRIAYLRLDDTSVPDFVVVDQIPAVQNVESTPYPRPGDPNPIVRLGVVAVAGGDTSWADTGKYEPADLLIVDVAWMPDSRHVSYQAQNREQTWLDLNVIDPERGSFRTLLRETTPAWVDNNGPPVWLADGSFLWLSERSGWEHIYHYRADGSLIRQVTDGEWEVRTLHGVDEDAGVVYFSGTERSHIGSDVYRARLDGTGLTRLSGPAGTHTAIFNPSYTMYADEWSDVRHPPQLRVHRADGTEVRVVEANAVPALSQYRRSAPELVQVPTRDGFEMEAMIVKPVDFDPTRKYPVLQHVYGGPHAPQVKNAWGGISGLYFQLLAERGIIVWVCDNRTASGKGARSAWPAYKHLGELELQDIEDGLTWLKQQPWVDASRIGLSGWSYGGFMTTYALTHSTSFAMGIAGGSVTDLRNYDSIYTERFMLTPEHNAEGYARSAPRTAAESLSGQLLLLHGAIDDNVHVQNTMQLAYALQRAGKPFELMIYPKSRHSVTDPLLVKHLRALMLDFTLRTLVPERAPATASASQPAGAH